jgi:hypothetical protein
MILRIVFTVVASWLIAAHFFRAGDYIVVALCLAAPALFFVRRRWSLLVLEGLSYAAAVVWLVTAWQIVEMDKLFGKPWLRAAIILGAVAAFTALSGFLLRSRTLRAPSAE